MITSMKTAARLFKALADETRLRILALLSRGELCVCDLMAVLDLPQSTVSRHLAYLRNAGWVEDRRQGVWMYYRLALSDSPLQRELLPLLTARLAEVPEARKRLIALDEYLKDKTGSSCG
jgi:ArsR family transcriptional regulator